MDHHEFDFAKIFPFFPPAENKALTSSNLRNKGLTDAKMSRNPPNSEKNRNLFAKSANNRGRWEMRRNGLLAWAQRLVEPGVVEMEAGGLLVGGGKGGEFGFLEVGGEKGEGDWSSGTADVVVVAVVDGGRGRCVGSAEAVGQDKGGVAGEIGTDELAVGGGGDDDVDLLEEGGHLADGEGAGAVGLDVVDRGVKAGNAKGVWPVFGALLSEEGVAAGEGQVVECSGGFSGEQGDHGVKGEGGKVDGDEVDAHGAKLVERGGEEAAIVVDAGAGDAGVVVALGSSASFVRGLVGLGVFELKRLRRVELGFQIADAGCGYVEIDRPIKCPICCGYVFSVRPEDLFQD